LSRFGEPDAYLAARADPNAGAILLADLTTEGGWIVLGGISEIVDFVADIIDWFRPVFAEKP
jgi:hypothetical protein